MIKDIRKHIKELRHSNMIRHHYVCTPLLNYTKFGKTEDSSYLDPDVISKNKNNTDLSIEKDISPRFVNFHEIILNSYQKILTNNIKSKESGQNKDKILNIKKIYEDALTDYEEINLIKEVKNLWPVEVGNDKDSNNKNITEIKFESITKSKDKVADLCIGLVNMQLEDKYIEKSYLQDPVFNSKRKKDLKRLEKLVHHTQKQIDRKIDVLVLPELSVPFNALDWMCDYAQREQILMIFGIEHWVSNNIAYNMVATLVPFSIKVSDDSQEGTIKGLFPILRIKNHYAPDERLILESYRYEIPKLDPYEYFLIKWKGVHFSVFNCYELADIQHRAMFRSLVDVLFACNYNLDTHYYSNIIESVVRDVHCYFVQSNNALEGDSRITKPTKSAFMNQVQIKGGKNTSIIVDTIDIEAIRKFQIQNFNHCNRNLDFKPTPPGFDVEKSMNRYGKQLNQKNNLK